MNPVRSCPSGGFIGVSNVVVPGRALPINDRFHYNSSVKLYDFLSNFGNRRQLRGLTILNIHSTLGIPIRCCRLQKPCEAAAEGRQVGEDINTKCTGDIKVGDLLKKAGDHLLDIHSIPTVPRGRSTSRYVLLLSCVVCVTSRDIHVSCSRLGDCVRI